MVSIKESKVVDAKIEKVWEIISDVDKDPEYWKGISSIRNIRKETNLVERVATVGIIGNEGLQTIKLNPKQSIDLIMTSGPLKGYRTIRLIPLESGKKTKIDVEWNFEFSKVPTFARGFVKSKIEETTTAALEEIARVAETSAKTVQKPKPA
jgi:ribosome-associated toxin RatA of RatAB toxin-antitoxin module